MRWIVKLYRLGPYQRRAGLSFESSPTSKYCTFSTELALWWAVIYVRRVSQFVRD
jgi:hypothetical protein